MYSCEKLGQRFFKEMLIMYVIIPNEKMFRFFLICRKYFLIPNIETQPPTKWWHGITQCEKIVQMPKTDCIMN